MPEGPWAFGASPRTCPATLVCALQWDACQSGTREIILIHHTDCGMLTFSDDELKAQIHEDVGLKPHFSMESFSDLEEDVRQSRARIQASPFISHKDGVRGFIYEVETGRLREVS